MIEAISSGWLPFGSLSELLKAVGAEGAAEF